jgi:response regulator RpfG family c-di-GMP phosphodiesterase
MMKLVGPFPGNVWQRVIGFFTTPTVESHPPKADVSGAPAQDSMPQYEETDRVWIIIDEEPHLCQKSRALVEGSWERKTLVFDSTHRASQWIDDFHTGCYDGPVPELTISNVRTPHSPGHEVCARLRRIPELSEMVVVITTAYLFSVEQYHTIMRTSQPDLILYKPVPVSDEFKVLLEGMIEGRRQKVSEQ